MNIITSTSVFCRYLTFSILLFSLLGLSACDWESDGLEILKNRYLEDGDEEAEEEIEAIEMEVSGDTTSGVWLMKEELVGNATFLIDEIVLVQTLYYLVTISEDGSTMQADFCHYKGVPYKDESRTEEDTTGKNHTPADTEGKIPGWEAELDGSETSLEPGEIVWLWGVKESAGDPKTMTLPTENDLANADDQDEDGNPGVSLEVDGMGVRYMARRQITTYAKADLSDDGQWLTGSLEFTSEDSPLGAAISTVNRTAEVFPIDGASRYWLRRIGALDDDETYTCENQMAQADGLFVEAPQE